MDLNDKIELFFFPPSKTPDEYRAFYQQVNPERFAKEKRTRFSPLYLLMRDIRHCFGIGRQFNPIRDELNPAEFAGVILIRIAFTNTWKKLKLGDWKSFAANYLEVDDPKLARALNDLRNALEHSYYSLFTYPKDRKVKTKVYFTLGYFDQLIIQDIKWRRDYPSEMYLVNPRKLYSAFERGTRKMKQELQDENNDKQRNNFQTNLSLDEWVAI